MSENLDTHERVSLSATLGCLGGTFPGLRHRSEERHPTHSGFLDVLLSPWRATPWAMRSPSWLNLQKEISRRLYATNFPGGIILVGDPFSVNKITDSMANSAHEFLIEFDMSRCSGESGVEALLGPPAGYIGFKEEGSPFVKALRAASLACDKWAQGHPAHRPLPVVVFKNIDRAIGTAQQVAHLLATKNTIALPTGEELKLNASLVVATCTTLPISSSSVEEAKTQLRAAVSAHHPRPLFDPAVAEDFFPVVLPPPDLESFTSAVSMLAGSLWAKSLPKGTLIHHKFFAGPNLVSNIINNAGLGDSDGAWDRLAEKITTSAKKIIPSLPTSELPSSFVTPALMGVCVEEEEASVWVEFRSFEEIKSMTVDLSLPYGVAEFLGVAVPSSLYWTSSTAKNEMSDVIVGNQDLIKDVASKIEFFASTTRRQPVMSALLMGPTGTGKTHFAKAVASAYRRPLVTINCASLKTVEDLQEALFGFNQTSLASKIAAYPASVVLLDEVEKAHSSIWYLLMEALDEGILRAEGRPPVVLSKCVIFATSNLLSTQLSASISQFLGKDTQEIDALLRGMLKGFDSVDPACMARINRAYLLAPPLGEDERALWKMFLEKDHSLKITPPALSRAIDNYHEQFSSSDARGVRSACQNIVNSPSSIGLLESGGTLDVCPNSSSPLSTRQNKWLSVSESSEPFEKASTHGWAASLVQDVFLINANKKAPTSPQGVFYLSGPSGSGKTHFGRELSSNLGKGEALVVDCSAMADPSAASSFLLGELGEKRGLLTSSLISQPDRVVIFDEIDKAPSGVLNQLLGILDKGKVFDQFSGEEVAMLNAVFFFTSNYQPPKMQELSDLVAAHVYGGSPSLPPEEACDIALASLVASGQLTAEQASRMDLVIPFGLPTKSEYDVYSSKIVEGVLEEFGLPLSFSGELKHALPLTEVYTLDSRSLRREASRAAAAISKKLRDESVTR